MRRPRRPSGAPRRAASDARPWRRRRYENLRTAIEHGARHAREAQEATRTSTVEHGRCLPSVCWGEEGRSRRRGSGKMGKEFGGAQEDSANTKMAALIRWTCRKRVRQVGQSRQSLLCTKPGATLWSFYPPRTHLSFVLTGKDHVCAPTKLGSSVVSLW